jgi:hypothetical protein
MFLYYSRLSLIFFVQVQIRILTGRFYLRCVVRFIYFLLVFKQDKVNEGNEIICEYESAVTTSTAIIQTKLHYKLSSE